MKTKLLILIAALGLTAASSRGAAISFLFSTSSNSINGNTTLADLHDTAIDGKTTATSFDLSSILAGLTITVEPTQDDISYTTSGLGVDTGGDMNTAGDGLIFTFNKAISLDLVDFGNFTGNGDPGDDEVQISFSNANPSINIVEADFASSSANTLSFSSGTSLAANESFTISYVDGNGFTLEGFDITAVPEPSSIIMMGLVGLAAVMVLRKRK